MKFFILRNGLEIQLHCESKEFVRYLVFPNKHIAKIT